MCHLSALGHASHARHLSMGLPSPQAPGRIVYRRTNRAYLLFFMRTSPALPGLSLCRLSPP
jgi:hypothetical protein